MTVSKTDAKGAIRTLAIYAKNTIEPHYEAKRNALPDKKNYDRIDKRYQSRSIQARMAITTLTSEIEAMPDDNKN